MKERALLLCLVVCSISMSAQIGIGTTTPTSGSILDIQSSEKGILIPRLTYTQRLAMNLNTSHAGMMVYQSDVNTTPKGLYTFDGINWIPPILTSTLNGQTLRWDGVKWTPSSALFNAGSSVGINTTSPNVQLHVHSTTSATKFQITNAANNAFSNDGLLIGVGPANSYAYIAQQENRPLYFSTNNAERMRIDSTGKIGINKTNPSATLDVAGTVKLGVNGSTINSIIHEAVMIDVPLLLSLAGLPVEVPFPGASTTGSVHISPAAGLGDVMISYARVCAPNTLEVKFMNLGSVLIDPAEQMFYITVIQ